VNVIKLLIFTLIAAGSLAVSAFEQPERVYQECDVNTTCPEGTSCYALDKFETPVCLYPEEVCPLACGTEECMIMESYPMQVGCEDGGGDTTPPEGVTTCKNPAGYCEIGDTIGYCECADGSGVAWTEAQEEDPVEPSGTSTSGLRSIPSEEQCIETLEEMCGTEPYEVTTCENPAGYCEIGENSGYCECLNGMGSGWASGSSGGGDSTDGSTGEPEVDPVEPGVEPEPAPEPAVKSTANLRELPTDEQCMETLVEICGEEAPSLTEICSEESLIRCVDIVSELSELCLEPISEEEQNSLLNGEWTENASDIAGCCEYIDEAEEYYTQVKECLESYSCSECMEGFLDDDVATEASGGESNSDSTTGGSSQTTSDTVDGAETAEESENGVTSGCSTLII
jgi:hypothetical protein